jgi:hypothetical protein
MLGANPPEPVESSMLTIYNSPGRRLRSPRRHELETLPLPQVDSRRAAQTIRDAVQLFLDDQAARGLESSSQKKYRTVLQNQLLVWMEKHKIMPLDRIMPADLTRFRATWHNGESTTHRKHEIIMCFFGFCIRNGCLRKNPMEALSKPKTPDVAYIPNAALFWTKAA